MQAIVTAPAKINLTLNMEGRRADGYHLLSSVFQSVSYADTVRLTVGDTAGIVLSVSDPTIPADHRNTAYKAAEVFYDRLGQMPSVTIHVEKAIPSQAGLGGGSADAAAVLVGLNALYGYPFDTNTLCELGERVGADVPFCIVGGTAFVEGIGEIITPMPPMPPCALLIAKPPVGVSTKEAYAAVDSVATVPADQEAMKRAFDRGDLAAIGAGLSNAFEQALDLPEVDHLLAQMRACEPLGCMMSGSGSAVFAVFADEAAANACAEQLSPCVPHRVCVPLSHGAEVIELS